MRNMTFTVLGILFVICTVGGLHLPHSCKSDGDCTQPGTYCYQSGQCVECTKCSLYNRSPGSGCAKDKNKCGDCLPGMESEDNLDGTFSCSPTSAGTLSPSTQAPKTEESNNTIFIYIALGVIGLVLILGFCCYCIWQKTDTCVIIRSILKICPNNGFMSSGGGEHTKCPENFQQHHQLPVSHGPPTYEEANPSAPPLEDPPRGNRSPICEKVSRTKENDPSQTANAYQNPLYVSGGRLGTNPEPEEENEASENDSLINITSISHPDDEETQPSTWTPTPGSGTASTTGPTSFAGALSMDNLHITPPNPNVSFSVQHSNSHPSFNFSSSNPPETENSSDSTTPQVNINVNVVNLCNISSTVSK